MTTLGPEFRSSWPSDLKFACMFKIKISGNNLIVTIKSASHHDNWFLSLIKKNKNKKSNQKTLLFFFFFAHSIILAWDIHSQKNLSGYHPLGSKRAGHDLVTGAVTSQQESSVLVCKSSEFPGSKNLKELTQMLHDILLWELQGSLRLELDLGKILL